MNGIRTWSKAIGDDWEYDPADPSVGIMTDALWHFHDPDDDENVAGVDTAEPVATRYHTIDRDHYGNAEYGKLTELFACPKCGDRVLRTTKDLF